MNFHYFSAADSESGAPLSSTQISQEHAVITAHVDTAGSGSALVAKLRYRLQQSVIQSTARRPSFKEIISKELEYYKSSGELGPVLRSTKDALTSIPPTSVEAERAFSATGNFLTKVRSRMGNDTLSMLCFLRHHFKSL